MKSTILILFMALIGFNHPNNSIQITGTVYDQSGKNPLYGANLTVKGTTINTRTDFNGKYRISVPNQQSVLVVSAIGFISQEVAVGANSVIDFHLKSGQLVHAPEEELEMTVMEEMSDQYNKAAPGRTSRRLPQGVISSQSYYPAQEQYLQHNTEAYDAIQENIFHDPLQNPLSTFSIDVDAASYSNVRRFLRQGQLPPKDAVRIEELVNYFDYQYDEPRGEEPFAVFSELSTAPWNSEHQLVHIGLQGKTIPTENLPPSNLVFLIDVSGSMNSPNKLGLLKSAFKLLTKQLRPDDRVSLVVYAGAAGVVLPSTSGSQKQTILEALSQLQAGGSTAGGQGIRLAYNIAREQFMEGGNNRVILATDGDFNVGASSNAEMERLIEQEREHGIFLTVLGFGMGNYKDSKMETLADKGNGNYAYIDDIMEAKKVLVNEFGGTLFTIAKDVKLQVEFNPAYVKAYRLIGYENRKLRDEDFNDDRKDAGELGSGHTVTALYEIIPHGTTSQSNYIGTIDDLKYQKRETLTDGDFNGELMTVKLRYKQPQGNRSSLITELVAAEPVPESRTSDNFRWSAAVASFGMLLRDSEFKGESTFVKVEEWARGAQDNDPQGYRAEFIKLVQSVELLAQH